MEGVLGRSSILSRKGGSNSPSGEDGGTILVRRVNPSSCSRDRARGGSCPSAWNRCDGARGRHGTSEDGTISVKAPPVVAETSAGGPHPERREALPHRKLGRGSIGRHGGYLSGLWGQRVHRTRIGRSERKRIAALPLVGSGRANGSGPPRAPTPNEGSRWQNARERGTVESVFNLQD